VYEQQGRRQGRNSQYLDHGLVPLDDQDGVGRDAPGELRNSQPLVNDRECCVASQRADACDGSKSN
jgi:hypothetical protein